MVESIRALKEQPGKDISITGSPTLVRTLLRAGLIDELRLLVHPIVVGHGKRLFETEDQADPAEAARVEDLPDRRPVDDLRPRRLTETRINAQNHPTTKEDLDVQHHAPVRDFQGRHDDRLRPTR